MDGDDPRVGVLGAIEARVNGQRPALGAQQRRLLAALAERAGQPVSAERLAEALWPAGALPQDWRGALRVAVSRLRSAVGRDDLVASSGGGYRLELEPDAIDAVRFDRLLAAADNEPDPAARADSLAIAIEEWRGSAYEEIADEPWIEGEARRLEELRLLAVEKWAQSLVDADRAAVAAAQLESWVILHPLREPFRRVLMAALQQVGRQAEAIEVYQDYRRQLASGVGLDPSPELQELERSILLTGGVDPETVLSELRGFELGERVGEGAFSVVYRGHQPSVDRDVAIKVIRSELANRPEFIRRFEAEAHMVAHLEHPRIVPLYDYWREPDRAYLVMRWLRGGSLEAHLDGGPLSPDMLCRLAQQVGEALTVAHRAGVVHRDVKPANILLDEDDNAYLGDFGIALDAAEQHDPEAALSAGSPVYAAPEQLRREPAGPQADVHGLAISLFEALTGSLPFPDASTQAEVLVRQLNDDVPAPSTKVDGVPSRVDNVFARATAKDPRDRYPAVSEFVDDLLAAFGDGDSSNQLRSPARSTLISAIELSNPYKGLLAFQEADTATFFGRDRLIDELLRQLDGDQAEHRFLAVVGPSGSGKSSVVRAGLLPALRAGKISGSREWFYVTLLPSRNPFEELETAMLRVSVNPPSSLLDQLTSDRRGILRACRRILPDDGTELVVLVDQFEELFTLCEDDSLRARFIDALTVAVNEPGTPVRLIVTLRADFYDRPLRYPQLAQLMKSSTVTVMPLAPDELEHAIVDPVAPMGMEFEPGLVSRIVADVADQPGALPLLQYALMSLFDRHQSGLLTLDAYRELGGVTGALASRAEGLYEQSDLAEQEATRRLFSRLTTLGEGSEDTRRRVVRSELGESAATGNVLDRFGRARLLSFDREPISREPTVEVAHEALIREWPRLRAWVQDDRDALRVHRRLTEAALSWRDVGEDPSELYRGGRLEAAVELASTHGGDLNPAEQAFVDASSVLAAQEASQERQRVRRLRTLLTGVAVLLAIALVAGAVAFVQQRSAQASRDEAVTARSDAETRRMSSDAIGLVDESPVVAALLAVEAYNRSPSHLTLGALQRVLTGTGPVLGYLGTDQNYSAIDWLPGDGQRLAAVHNGGVDLFDLTTGGRRQIDVRSSGALAVSPDGSMVAVATPDGPVTVRSIADGSELALLPHSIVVRAMSFAPDGTLVTGTRDGWLRLWTVDGQLVAETHAHPENSDEDIPPHLRPSEADLHEVTTLPVGVTSVAWHPGLRSWATTGGVWVRTWSASLARQSEIEIDRPRFTDTLVGDGRVAGRPTDLVVGAGTSIQVAVETVVQSRDAIDGEIHAEFSPSESNVLLYGGGTQPFTVGRAGDTVVAAHRDRRIETYDLDGRSVGVGVGIEIAAPAAGYEVATSPDGRTLAVAGLGGIAVISRDGRQALAKAVPRDTQVETSLTRDGSLLAASSLFENRPSLWNMETDPPSRLPLPALDDIYRVIIPQNGPPHLLTLDGAVHGLGADLEVSDFVVPAAAGLVGTSGAVIWSPDEELAVFGGFENVRIQIRDAASGTLINELTDLEDLTFGSEVQSVSSMTFSPDGSRLAAATSSGVALVWDTSTWRVVGAPLSEGGGQIHAIGYSPDGELLVTGGDSDELVIRNATTGQPTGTVLVDAAKSDLRLSISPFAFSADSRYLLRAGTSTPVLFDLDAGQPVGGAFPGEAGYEILAPTGARTVATIIADDILVWDLGTERWPEVACRFAGRNLTADEWTQFGPSGEPYEPTCVHWPSEVQRERTS